MSRIDIAGIGVEYELLGEAGAPTIALTPGGRFAKETPGLHELAERLVAGGRRVLLWDRPNCGASDISFDAGSESDLHAQTLTRLIRALDLGPVTLAAGSAGSRVSLIAAAYDPEIVAQLALWWISGGNVSLMSLAVFYYMESLGAVGRGGMEAVVQAQAWADQIKRNPSNRDILLAMDPDWFIDKMQDWATFFIPRPDSPVPGMTSADFARLTMPTLILRNGKSDMSHTRRTTEWVHELIPHSTMAEPPWPDQEWNNRTIAMQTTGSGLFVGWPALAPALLDFTSGG